MQNSLLYDQNICLNKRKLHIWKQSYIAEESCV